MYMGIIILTLNPSVTLQICIPGILYIAAYSFSYWSSLVTQDEVSLLAQVFGDSFLHGGRPADGPRYVDPQDLLSETTVDPYIPLR